MRCISWKRSWCDVLWRSGKLTPSEDKSNQQSHHWEERVAEKEARKLRALHNKNRSIWFGLGTFGMVGWSVVVPAMLGLFIGIWIDHTWPGRFSWTLMLFLGGLGLGCYNAWRWLHFEGGLIDGEEQDDDACGE
ncbi:MAG: AtpZ/AtpI family protein [Anaerolineae bacterium]|nr:AtpZ/AtpI family protein [Anaerolineae bacterium]